MSTLKCLCVPEDDVARANHVAVRTVGYIESAVDSYDSDEDGHLEDHAVPAFVMLDDKGELAEDDADNATEYFVYCAKNQEVDHSRLKFEFGVAGITFFEHELEQVDDDGNPPEFEDENGGEGEEDDDEDEEQ